MRIYQLKNAAGEVIAEFSTTSQLPEGVANVVLVPQQPMGGGGPGEEKLEQ
jgi:hypothetical protein